MDDLETRIREELRGAVDHVEVSPDLWERIQRRHRREPRKRMLEVATSLTVLVVAAVVLFPVARGLVSEQDTPPAADDVFGEVNTTDLPTLGPTEVAPLGLPQDPVPVLATGEIDGTRWMFTAFWNSGGRVTYGLPQFEPGMDGDGVALAVGMNPPLPILLGVASGGENPSIVFGLVDKEAARVQVTLPGGETADATIVGQDGRFPANFFVLPVATGVDVGRVSAVSYDAEGRELERDVIEDASPVGESPLGLEPATGPVVPLDSGEIDGMPWEFVAHPWQEGICYGFLEDQPGQASGGAWCEGDNPLELSPGEVAPVAKSQGSGQGQPSFVFGPVRKDAALVRIEFPSGEVNEVEPVGQQAGLAVNFYVQAYPIDTNVDSAQVNVSDASGRELGSSSEPPASEPGRSPLGLEPPTGPVVTLDSGEIEGMPWEFVAHRWDEGICFGFRNEQGMAGGGVAVCDPAIPGIGVRGDGGEGQPAFVWGAFPRDTEVIRIQLIDGQAFEAPPLGQEEFGVSFFVRVLPTGTSMEGVRAVEVAQAEGIGDPVPTTTTPNG